MKEINEHDLGEIKKCLGAISDFILNKRWVSNNSRKELLTYSTIIKRMLDMEPKLDTEPKEEARIIGAKTLLKR
jgi:hypothetical protein